MDPGPQIGGDARDLAVEVVVTNYNYGAYVADAIESALGQTHPRVRTIVVDDGSSDESRDVLRSFEDRVDIVLKENGGQASAVNAGLERCTGDVVLMLDADDVLGPEAANRAAAEFARDPDLVKLQYRMDLIDAEGRPTGETKPAPHLPMPKGDMRRAELSFPFDLTWMSMSGNAFRRSALQPILPIPEPEYRICADWYLVHAAALLGRVESLQQVTCSYRMHGSNNYEPQSAQVDLDHVRENIRLARATTAQLERLADRLGLDRPEPILSLADLANRIISLRLDPERHPLAEDSRTSLLRASVRAAARRFDAGFPMKAMYVGWFAAMAIAPRPPARRLAELFLFPGRRAGLNRVIGRLQRPTAVSG
jgi:GT2 family glycosyltransferase